jgi:hypothetical protein
MHLGNNTMPLSFLDLSAGTARTFPDATPVLTCSSELRNRVYNYATEHRYQTRHFLALTQTCKQIRAEFRPIYLQSGIHLTFGKLLPFLDVFLPSKYQAGDIPMDEFAADLRVDASHGSIHRGNDILLTIQLLKAAPNVHVRFVDDTWIRGGECFDMIVACRDEWVKILKQGTIESVEFFRVSRAGDEEVTECRVSLSSNTTWPWVLYDPTRREIHEPFGITHWLRGLRIAEDGNDFAFHEWLEMQSEENEWCAVWKNIVRVFDYPPIYW